MIDFRRDGIQALPNMDIVAIGRSQALYDTITVLAASGHNITAIITAREAPEYTRSADDFAELAHEIGAPFFRSIDANSLPSSVAGDIAVSINYPAIIPQTFIDRFRLGILNGHGGDLPRYRGNACHGWAILNGEKQTAVTIHKMEGGELDSGDIIARQYFQISPSTKIGDILLWSNKTLPVLFANALRAMEDDPDFILERQNGGGRRCYPMLPCDGAIVWSQTAEQIIRIVKASSRPFAGAYCFRDGQKLIVWDAEEVATSEAILAFPGQVTQIGNDFLDVATGRGIIRITDMSPAMPCVTSIRTRLLDGTSFPFLPHAQREPRGRMDLPVVSA